MKHNQAMIRRVSNGFIITTSVDSWMQPDSGSTILARDPEELGKTIQELFTEYKLEGAVTSADSTSAASSSLSPACPPPASPES